jgi:aspartate/methionine/tyrosine aminotransferase
MLYRRMPIEVESPEQMGYETIRNNLSESSYTDALFRDFPPGADLGNLALCYGSHQGHEGLRGLLVKDAMRHGGGGSAREHSPLTNDDVLLTMGAAGALFILATSLLEKEDELVVVHPNYATNLETPRAIGATLRTIELKFENGFAPDIARIADAITPRTRYISVTHPHNPSGVCLADDQLAQLARIAEDNGIYVLVDETYRDMVFGEQLPLAATYSARMISISSLSKTYGLPGLRIGWIICRDAGLMETFLAAKEQIHICGPVLEEELAYRYLQHRDAHLAQIRADIRAKFGLVKDWMQREGAWEWVEPAGGCVCFPRLRRPQDIDVGAFYRILLDRYGTYVGPGHWFDMPDHYMRIGFGWPEAQRLEEGLDALSRAVRDARKGQAW